MEIISRKEAKVKGLDRYYTGKECKHGHVAERYVSTWTCVECNREVKTGDEYREYMREYARQYRQENPDKVRERHRKYYQDNLEKERERMRKYARQHYQDNKSLYYAKDAKRRASELQRTLPGHDFEIFLIYEEAQQMRESGLDVHVDHIIPLQGETVSGLHVPWNLRIISSEENLAKGNRLIPEHVIEIY